MDKVSKQSVDYRPGTETEHCGNCSMYSSRTCTLVRGLINPDDTCNKWNPKNEDKGNGIREIRLIRHGGTSRNHDDISVDRIRSWDDVPLSASGRDEARRLAISMARNKPDLIITSDLTRAHDTAKIISHEIGVPIVEVSKSLRPWNVGNLAGKRTVDAFPVLLQYAHWSPNKPVPKHGESFNGFTTRFFKGLYQALRKHPGTIAVISHHRNERALHGWQKAGFPKDGSIDLKEFGEKGAATAQIEIMNLPMAKLKTAARS